MRRIGEHRRIHVLDAVVRQVQVAHGSARFSQGRRRHGHKLVEGLKKKLFTLVSAHNSCSVH